MFPTARRTAAALTLGAAAFTLAGCSLPGLPGGTPSVATPTVGTPSTEPSAQPSAPTEPSTAPTPSRRATPTTRTATPRPSYTPRPGATPDSDDIENGYVPRASVELKVGSMIREKVGKSALVECPGNLTAKVGETMTCQAKLMGSADSTRRPVEVKVAEIQGRQVRFTVQLA